MVGEISTATRIEVLGAIRSRALPRGRRIYDEAVRQALIVVWESLFVCRIGANSYQTLHLGLSLA